GDTGVDSVKEDAEASGRTLTGDVGLVALVDVVGDQRRGLSIGACDDPGRDVGHVRGQTCGVQRLDVLAGGDEDLATQVPTLLLGGQLVLPVHPGGTGADHALHQLVGVENTTETGLGVGDDRGQPVGGVVITLGPGDLVGAQERVVDPTHHGRNRVGRVEALVRVGVAGKVGVGGHLPAGEVDRLQPGADLLERLVTGERTERADVVLGVEQVPEALRAAAGQGVLFGDRTAQLDHVVGGIGPLDARPPGVGLPVALQSGAGFLTTSAGAHVRSRLRVVPKVFTPVEESCSGPGGEPRAVSSPPVTMILEEVSRLFHPKTGEERCFFLYHEAMAYFGTEEIRSLTGDLDLVTFGQRLRHLRKARGLTLSDLGERVGRAPSQLSLLENGKREPKLSLLTSLASALGVSIEELLSKQPPSRRAQLEISVEEAQRDPLYQELNLPHLKVGKRVPNDVLEHIVGLYEELKRRHAKPAASPEEARRATAGLRRQMRERGNYFEHIEKAAAETLRAVNYSAGPLSQGQILAIATHHGFSLKYVQDLPRSV